MQANHKLKPAIAGGKPVRKKMLPLHQSDFSQAEEKAVIKVLRSGWLTKGPQTKTLEEKFTKFVKAKYAIGTNSGTSALHLALSCLDLKKGDEIIVSPLTFVSAINSIIHCNCKPVFVDVDPLTLNIDPEQIESKINMRTKCIMPVHLYGQACVMNKILRIAKKNKIFVISDAAHALETVYNRKKIGSIGDITCFSFHPAKNITSGEGGMLVTNNKKFAQKAQMLSLHGIDKSTWTRYTQDRFQHWTTIAPGFKYHMTDLQAAIGLAQLEKIKKFWQKRKKYTKMYLSAFKDIPQIRVITKMSSLKNKNAYHLFIIQIDTKMLKINRDYILNALLAENIGVGVHYRAIHLHSFYKNHFSFKKGMLPQAEYAAERIITLPLYPKMKQSDISDVIDAVSKVITYYKK
ncbi:MAG: DegT/DnrJ/EryC1/StrS family aminotransferase [Candidatus Omnitrophota bacterium]